MVTGKSSLATRVVRWQEQHGRHDLPWQRNRDPYAVWLSEIMLQQTQVSTVIGYFDRFVASLPDVEALASASEDEVLGLWSGLGYYSRARNLHRCAREIVQRWEGKFPRRAEQLVTLPGIGRSTAAAIASLCFGEPVAILDANVKRVLARATGFSADLASAANERALWDIAEASLPTQDLSNTMPRYTQGMMDLGATVCHARRPTCLVCPLNDLCEARRQGRQEAFPVKSRKIKRSAQALWLLWAQDHQGAAWLQRRPAPGIWAGLYCMPWFDTREDLLASLPAALHPSLNALPTFTHVLTHKDLHIHTFRLQLPRNVPGPGEGAWFAAADWRALGLPAPVRRLLLQA